MKFILGKKLGMSQIFNEKGNIVPVTLIEAGPCIVTQIKTKEKDGYNAVQIGFQKIEKEKKIKKSIFKKPFKQLKEFKNKELEIKDYQLGKEIDASFFKEGDSVKISGLTKGKGFAGVVKRWGFKGKKSKTHGTKHEARTPGSVGCSFPQRVVKGRKMAGHMGYERSTVKNLKIVKVDIENNILAVKGAVPGRKETLLEIRDK